MPKATNTTTTTCSISEDRLLQAALSGVLVRVNTVGDFLADLRRLMSSTADGSHFDVSSIHRWADQIDLLANVLFEQADELLRAKDLVDAGEGVA